MDLGWSRSLGSRTRLHAGRRSQVVVSGIVAKPGHGKSRILGRTMGDQEGMAVASQGRARGMGVLSARLRPLPSPRGRKESPFSFLLFSNPKDLFDFLENYGQENHFLCFFSFFFFFSRKLSHLKTSQAPAVSKPAEFHVTRLFPCSCRASEREASSAEGPIKSSKPTPPPTPPLPFSLGP